MSDQQINSYTFSSEFDPSVSQFFSTNTLNQWTFDNFKNFIPKDNTTDSDFSLQRQFLNNLDKIIKNDNVPDKVKGKAGNIKIQDKRKVVEDAKDKEGANDKSVVLNVKIDTHNNTVFGDVNHYHDNIQPGKKQKTDHVVDETGTWNINSHDDLWEAILQHMQATSTHEFSLDSYHIINLGYSIRCNPSIPTELFEHVKVENYTISIPFKTYSSYTANVLNAMKTNNVDSVEDIVKSETIVGNDCHAFVKEFFRACLWIYKKPNLYSRLSLCENGFNHNFIWPVMEFAVDQVKDAFKFHHAEYILKAADEENKVDACVIFENVELCILETSGKLYLNDNTKYGRDHIKAHYGALSMVNKIYKDYCYAKQETASKLCIPFIHARHDTLHLWVLENCSSKLYCSSKVYKCKVPVDMAATKDILELGTFAWCLKRIISTTVDTIKAMKQEHDDYMVRRMLFNEDSNRTSLTGLLKLDIMKPTAISGYYLLVPEEEESLVKYTNYETHNN